MSAKPEIPAEDLVTIEINGRPYQARKGQMVIEITDANGITVPRFCYHPKLPVAANCRMCLVEVEKAPKPLPACATPVADGMKVWTDSDYARDAQKSVMEFLLINHPLDCPICDQGGECELQDVALCYGRDVSRFSEDKRVVADKNIGPLIATDMTRCIHCTRCIRFLENIAGYKELGGLGRGEHTEIGTYVEHAIGSELSGNVIDVCPVGALTSKPFRFRARAWELVQNAVVSPHDCVGSNLYLHSRRGEVMRAVPQENEAINEVWLSDRDRYSYEGINSGDRLERPMLRDDSGWREVEWEDALAAAAERLRKLVDVSADELGILVSPSATLEEMSLLARIAEGLGCPNIDHRLRQSDFRDDDRAPLFPSLGGTAIADLETRDAVLLVGSNVRKDQPIIGHRLRKAALEGAAIMAINPVDYGFTFDLAAAIHVPPSRMVPALAAVARAVAELKGVELPQGLATLAGPDAVGAEARAIAERLTGAERPQLLFGIGAQMHPRAADLHALGAFIARTTCAALGQLTDGANAAGAWIAGAVPHRAAGGAPAGRKGLNAAAMLDSPRRAYLLFGCEPDGDFADARAVRKALDTAELVVACTAWDSEVLRETADILLPITPLAETSGTLVNVEGRWQSFAGSVPPCGDARPGWRMLRVLGNLLGLQGFDYVSSEDVRDELRGEVADLSLQPGGFVADSVPASATEADGEGLERIGDPAPYAIDAQVRRATALQQHVDGGPARVRINTAEAARLGLAEAGRVRVRQGEAEALLELVIDDRVPDGSAWIPSGAAGSGDLGAAYGRVELKWV
ncbi:NADH-quinone oxidoreductase subunit NuoG [Thiohalobacter sp.]|uniref:NADH-quinone oxidoreductase subunit NuoG n=1 Tax=Thiohalobacter sp. TaxID=2025948 RepID=UPI002617AA3E|nr:NADH-quinone oxidoreductase subunit NuoG [Thiohalobacter sp.]